MSLYEKLYLLLTLTALGLRVWDMRRRGQK